MHGSSVTTYTWDDDNRLALVASGGPFQPTSYSYGADGLRRSTDAPQVEGRYLSHFLWDGENLLLVKEGGVPYLPNDTQYTNYPEIWGGLASQRRGTDLGTGVSTFYGFDLQANTGITTPPAGTPATPHLYKAFGERLGAGRRGSGSGSRRLPGQKRQAGRARPVESTSST